MAHKEKLHVAYSPCPNDTFMFHEIARKNLSLPSHEFKISLFDVEYLNQRAFTGEFDVTKMFFCCLNPNVA